MKKLIVLAIALLPLIATAQNFKGKLTDNFHNPVQDAYISNINTDMHTHSNPLGEFILTGVSIDDTVKISHVSFFSQIVVITKELLETELNYKLDKRIIDLGEITISNNIKSINAISAN